MPLTEIGDPRLQALFGASDPRKAGVKPTVRLPRKGLPPLALGALALVCAVLLFLVLNSRRTSQPEPAVALSPNSTASAWAPPPALYVPPQETAVVLPTDIVDRPKPTGVVAAPTQPVPAARTLQPQIVYTPEPAPQLLPTPNPAPQPRMSSGSALVIDTGTSRGSGAAVSTGSVPGPGSSGAPISRMRASAFANPLTTVPRGTIIPAVLETGFDSTKPGFARAIVSRDVRGFDGKTVLIPRGSRLTGDYQADVGQTQKRAVINWTRLIRPDGMMITMDSPAVDTVGRGGVPAHVNTHFLQRVGDALLQSTVGLGSALAQRAASGPVVVLSNNTLTNTPQITPTSSYVPTLTVPPGKSISVFVAHDLDFSSAAAPR